MTVHDPGQTLQCPACRIPMRVVELPGFQADECRLCDGVWLDDQEPEKLVCLAGMPQHLLEPIAFDDSERKVPEGQRQCPRCATRMRVFDHKGVRVDVCPDCRGMWLDRWELQKILAD